MVNVARMAYCSVKNPVLYPIRLIRDTIKIMDLFVLVCISHGNNMNNKTVIPKSFYSGADLGIGHIKDP